MFKISIKTTYDLCNGYAVSSVRKELNFLKHYLEELSAPKGKSSLQLEYRKLQVWHLTLYSWNQNMLQF
jgi:hypothetical protein